MGAYAGPTDNWTYIQYVASGNNANIVTSNLKIIVDGSINSPEKLAVPDVIANRVVGLPVFTSNANIDLANGTINVVNGLYTFGSKFTDIDLKDKTIQLWVYKRDLTAAGLLDKDFETPGYGGWGVWVNTGNKLQFWAQSGKDEFSNNAIAANVWTNIAVSHNVQSNTITFHIDGVWDNVAVDNTIVPKPSNSAPMIIGGIRGAVGGRSFDGQIASIFIYDKVLSNTEILQNYDSTKSRFGL